MFNYIPNELNDVGKLQQHPAKPNKSRTRSRKRKERNVLFYEQKRKAANERERKRMYSINEAFDKLRLQLPWLPRERKLSKASTLREAIRYIKQLNQLLNGEQPILEHTPQQQSGSFKPEAEERSSLIIPNSDEHLPIQFVELSCSKTPDCYGSVIKTDNGTVQGRCSKVWIPTTREYHYF